METYLGRLKYDRKFEKIRAQSSVDGLWSVFRNKHCNSERPWTTLMAELIISKK